MEEKTSHKTKKDKEGGNSKRKKLRRQKSSSELDAYVNENDQLHSDDYGVTRKLEHDTENVSSVKARKSAPSKSKRREFGMVNNAGGDTEMSEIKRSAKGKKVKKKLKKDVDKQIEINGDDDLYQISSGGEDYSKGVMNTKYVSSGKAKKSARSKTKKRTTGMVSNVGGDNEMPEIKRSGKGKKVKKKQKKDVDNKIEINEDDDVYQISLGDEDSLEGTMNTENISSGKAKKSALSKTKKRTIGMVINAGGDTETPVIRRSAKGKKVKEKPKKDVDNKVEINEDGDVYQISSGDEDFSKGMMKWLSEYHQCRPGVQILQQRIDDYIMAYDEKEEQERKTREAEAAEGGWTVVVHHKGRKKTTDEESGITVGAVSQASVIGKTEKKKDKIASDFYNFQKREAKRNELLMLQNKFEEDKKRIQQLRAARKFRPY